MTEKKNENLVGIDTNYTSLTLITITIILAVTILFSLVAYGLTTECFILVINTLIIAIPTAIIPITIIYLMDKHDNKNN